MGLELKAIKVGLSEAKAVRGAATLACESVGSGVVLCLFDPSTKVGGMAHVLLPSPAGKVEDGARSRYASSVLPALLSEMEIHGAVRSMISANLIGAAEAQGGGSEFALGRALVEVLRDQLQEQSIPLIANETGGHLPRTVWLHADTGRIELRTFVEKGTIDWEVAA